MIPDQTSVFEATALTKKFGDTIALNSVTLSLGGASSNWIDRTKWRRQNHLDSAHDWPVFAHRGNV